MGNAKRLTFDEVKSLDLFNQILAKAESDANKILKQIHTSQGRDKRRFFTEAQKRAIKSRDKSICYICGKYTDNGVYDHIIPFSKGGKTTIVNGGYCCVPCNSKKSNKVW